MKTFLEDIKKNYNAYLNYDEAATKISLIFPVLQKLGWDIFKRDEVFPEYPIESKRIDLSLRIDGENKFFIEIKRCNIDLENHQEQLLNYSFREGVNLAALTNGITWQFFLPLHSGSWQQRLFFTIDIENQSIEEITSAFEMILSKDSLLNNIAQEYAEDLLLEKNREEQVENNLPRAWKKLLDEPTSELIDLISDKTEKMCGYRPNHEQVINFINSINFNTKGGSNNIDYNKSQIPDRKIFNDINEYKNHREFIKIKGLNIPIDKYKDDMLYFEEVIPLLLKILSETEIRNLGDLEYINHNIAKRHRKYPIMSPDKSKFMSNDGTLNAWANPISGYYVCKPWYPTLFSAWKKYLENLQKKLGE